MGLGLVLFLALGLGLGLAFVRPPPALARPFTVLRVSRELVDCILDMGPVQADCLTRP